MYEVTQTVLASFLDISLRYELGSCAICSGLYPEFRGLVMNPGRKMSEIYIYTIVRDVRRN